MRTRPDGFTLIELLVTILIATLLLTLAVPSFLSSIHGQQTQSVAQNFIQDVAWVRGRAVSGAATATLSLAANCTWSVDTGDAGTDPTHGLTLQQITKDAPTLSCVGIPAGGLALSFDSMGLVDPPTSSGVITFTPGVGLPVSVEVFGSGMIVENPQHAS